MTEAILTENLSKYFKSVKAVSGLALNIHEGEIYGFLGLNGAGKTTTIRMLLGMIRPSEGAEYLFGKKVRPGENDIWRKTGHLVEVPYSYPDLTVRENLEIIRRLRFLSDRGVVDKIMEKLHITEYSDRLAKNLSQGNAQRLGLAKALIHNPRLLILDEPTNGLDPAGIVEIRGLLTSLAHNHGVTIFISSHILGEISRLTSRIGIIHNGLLLQEINTDQLELLCRKKLLIGSGNPEGVSALLTKHGYSCMKNDEATLELIDDRAIKNPAEISGLIINGGFSLTMLKTYEEDLESYFLRTIGMKGGEQ